MNRVYQNVLAEHLALATQNVKAAQVAVECQRNVVTRLSFEGHDTAKAEAMLVQLINSLMATNADRDQLQVELASERRLHPRTRN